MDIIREIKNLNFPLDKYIVVGGSAMAIRGLKETKDIDIVVAPDLFAELKAAGWKIHPRPNPLDEPGLEKGIMEIFLDVNARNGVFKPTFAELKSRQEIINDIPVANLEDVLKFKTDYNREKDQKDIQIIREYLQRKS